MGGGVILVAPKTQINISPKAHVLIDGILEINKPWGKRQVLSAYFDVDEEAELCVKGKFSFFSGCRISVNKKAYLLLNNGFMNENGSIACFERIEIGDQVIISDDVIIRDSDNHSIVREDYSKTRPIQIGNHVWIGLRSTILKGVHIEDGSVIAAGALVNKNVRSNVIVAGVPCKVIREEMKWER